MLTRQSNTVKEFTHKNTQHFGGWKAYAILIKEFKQMVKEFKTFSNAFYGTFNKDGQEFKMNWVGLRIKYLYWRFIKPFGYLVHYKQELKGKIETIKRNSVIVGVNELEECSSFTTWYFCRIIPFWWWLRDINEKEWKEITKDD